MSRLNEYLEMINKKENPYSNYKYAEGPTYYKEKELFDKWERENNPKTKVSDEDIKKQKDNQKKYEDLRIETNKVIEFCKKYKNQFGIRKHSAEEDIKNGIKLLKDLFKEGFSEEAIKKAFNESAGFWDMNSATARKILLYIKTIKEDKINEQIK